MMRRHGEPVAAAAAASTGRLPLAASPPAPCSSRSAVPLPLPLPSPGASTSQGTALEVPLGSCKSSVPEEARIGLLMLLEVSDRRGDDAHSRKRR